MKKTLVESVKENDVLTFSDFITESLKSKTLEVLKETKKQVAAESFIAEDETVTEGREQPRASAEHQAIFNKHWHRADDNEKNLLKKHAWRHGYDIPSLSGTQSHAKSPISGFSESEKE